MSPTQTNSITATLTLALVIGLGWTGVATQAAGPNPKAPTTNERLKAYRQQPNTVSAPPLFLPGELVVRLAAGATAQDAQALASYFGGQVGRKLRFAPNTYVIKNVQTNLDTAVQQLRTSPAVIKATKNQVFRPSALPPSEPNDSLYPQQWALKSSGAVNAWGIAVGQRLVDGPKKQVLVALIDGGPQTSHPDLAANFDTVNGWDFILDQQYDENAAGLLLFDNHATSVASCIAPLTNNSEGVAGFAWEGVKILPCRVADFFGSGTLNAGIPVSAVVDAIYYAIQQEADVINMSFGLFQEDALVEQAVIDAYNQGVIPVSSSGDGFFFSRAVEFPANMDEAIAVAAVGPSGEVATYSNSGPEVDLAAPGGNDQNFNDTTRQLVLAFPTSFFGFFGLPIGYGIDQGTSYSAGYVSGAIALLITQGAGENLTGAERVEAIKALLQSTARNPFGIPTPQLGAGRLDVERALKSITQYVDLVAPEPNEVTASTSEALVARVVLPIPAALDETMFQVFKNGQDVSLDTVITDPISGFIEYVPAPDDSYLTGVNRLNIISVDPSDPNCIRSLEGDAVTDVGVNIPDRAFRFRVAPRIEYPGLRMFSIPYDLEPGTGADTLAFLLGGTEGRLARWIPEQNRYAIFDPFGAPEELEADLTTLNAGVTDPPIGVGFWLRILPPELPPPPDGVNPPDPNAAQIRLQVRGRSNRAPFYRIPLKTGFNLVGTPYTFRVPFNVVNVQFGNEIMSVTEAARRGLMANVIWRYQDGRYTFQVLPNGEFVPWEAHWLQARANLTLIIPRVGAGLGVASSAPPAAGTRTAQAGSGWLNNFQASIRGRVSGEVFVGQSKAPASRLAQIQLPPAPQGTDDLRVLDRKAGRLAQDVRPAGSPHSWTLEYETSSPGEKVKLSWGAFPKTVAAVVQVNGRGPVSGNLSRSLTFTPDKPGVQRIQVSVLPIRGRA